MICNNFYFNFLLKKTLPLPIDCPVLSIVCMYVHCSIKSYVFIYSLSKDEVVACLMVTTGEVVSTLSGLVSCVGCRRSVETLYQTLSHSCDTALEPLMVSPDGVVSLDRYTSIVQ